MQSLSSQPEQQEPSAHCGHGARIGPQSVREVAGRVGETSMTTYSLRPPRIEAVIESACAHFYVEREQLMKGVRFPNVSAARKECCLNLRGMGFSLPVIGNYLNMHHTSVLAALGNRFKRERLECVPESPDVPDYSGEWAI